MEFSLRIFFVSDHGAWIFRDYRDIPVGRPCVIVLHSSGPGTRAQQEEILGSIHNLLLDLDATESGTGVLDWSALNLRNLNCLHAFICDSQPPAPAPDAEVLKSVAQNQWCWIMPVLNSAYRSGVTNILSKELQKTNVAFWVNSIGELALTFLARVGVTTLDRRVFISYRRVETSLMADQLFDGLTEMNFQVFLDRVSVEPGVDFQASLMEQLVDKSTIVVLNSPGFPDSHWTREEFEFARARGFKPMIVTLPKVETDLGAGPGEERVLREGDVNYVEMGDDTIAELEPAALQSLLKEIVFYHDLALIKRLRELRSTVQKAANNAVAAAASKNGGILTFAVSSTDFTITVDYSDDDTTLKSYSIHPSAYPPDLSALHDASTSNQVNAVRRIVVGHTSKLSPLRAKQLAWMVQGRNVSYHDIGATAVLFDLIMGGNL